MDTTTGNKINGFTQLWEKSATTAAQTFSKLVGHESFINVSETITTDPMTLYKQFGDSDSSVFTTVLRIEGDLNGYILVIWPTNQAKRMSRELTKINTKEKALTNLEKSALEELANIVTSSFLKEMNKFSELKVLQSTPESKADMLKAILDEISASITQTSKNILMLTTQLEILPVQASAFFSIVLDAPSGNKLLENILHE